MPEQPQARSFGCAECEDTGTVWETCHCYECEYDDKHGGLVPCHDCTFGQIRADLAELYKPEGVEIWLNGRHRELGGKRPIDLIDRGDGDRVQAIIARLLDGAFS